MKGKAFLAIKLSLIGSFFGIIFSVLCFFVFGLFLEKFSELIAFLVVPVLVIVLLAVVVAEKGLRKKFWTVFVIASSGILGLIVLRNFVFVENNLHHCY